MTKVTNQEVNLLGLVELSHRHLTDTLFRRVHKDVRSKEQQLQWTLHYLVQFWTAVILRAPVSLTQALNDARGLVGDKVRKDLYPPVEASPEAFFEKCRDLKWEFFHAVYEGFTESILPEAPRTYGTALGKIFEHFPDIFIIDGSKCDAIRHRLKLLWKEKSVVLPGAVTAIYDLARGITRHLLFSVDAAAHELPRAISLLAQLPKGALIIGDRLYALPKFFRALSDNGLWGLSRRNKIVKIKEIEVLSRKQDGRTLVEDLLVEAGSGQGGPKVMLRLIRYRHKELRRDLVTNVLDPTQLSAEEALELYPWRWSIERLFFDLKEVLNLHRFYAANANAVAMQIYAAAIVHTACRVCQSIIARDHGITPEEISPAKLYPKLAAASNDVAITGVYHIQLEEMHGHLERPDMKVFRFSTTTLDAILVEKRKGRRRMIHFHPERRHWKSLVQINGFKKLS
jgi:hypothetical protein